MIHEDMLKGRVDYTPTQERFVAAADDALKEGLVVKVADDLHLYLDLDTTTSIEQFLRMIPVFEEHFKVIRWDATYSKSRNVHVIVSLGRSLSEDKRIALQAVLGSDPKKEMASVRRSLEGITHVVRLFQPAKTEDAMDELMRISEGVIPIFEELD